MIKIVVEKYPDIVLASCSIRGFLVIDSSRRLMMDVSNDEEASFVVLYCTIESRQSEPESILSPYFLNIGSFSPVRELLSKEA